YFASCGESFLVQHNLSKSASNYLARQQLDLLCSDPGIKISATLPGDNARNVCEGMAYLGAKCAFAGAVGFDREAEIFCKSLEKSGIASFVRKLPGSTGLALSLVTPDKARTFAINLGSTEQFEEINESEISNSKFLFLTSISLLSSGKLGQACGRCIEAAKKHGVKVAMSLESYPMIEKNADTIAAWLEAGLVDVLFGNEEEFGALGIEDFSHMSKISYKLAPLIVLKRGESGATVFSSTGKSLDSKTISIPIAPPYVKDVVDTTGAGDYFAAGFLRGMCKGKKLSQCGKMGAELAGKTISRFGATLGKADAVA
ncbi:adenosine kinase, partial [Candidatus Parvarchaeota archaeon]|nr:adenosine kinase [Candidatus Parvarchaeota archaeon]